MGHYCQLHVPKGEPLVMSPRPYRPFSSQTLTRILNHSIAFLRGNIKLLSPSQVHGKRNILMIDSAVPDNVLGGLPFWVFLPLPWFQHFLRLWRYHQHLLLPFLPWLRHPSWQPQHRQLLNCRSLVRLPPPRRLLRAHPRMQGPGWSRLALPAHRPWSPFPPPLPSSHLCLQCCSFQLYRHRLSWIFFHFPNLYCLEKGFSF